MIAAVLTLSFCRSDLRPEALLIGVWRIVDDDSGKCAHALRCELPLLSTPSPTRDDAERRGRLLSYMVLLSSPSQQPRKGCIYNITMSPFSLDEHYIIVGRVAN